MICLHCWKTPAQRETMSFAEEPRESRSIPINEIQSTIAHRSATGSYCSRHLEAIIHSTCWLFHRVIHVNHVRTFQPHYAHVAISLLTRTNVRRSGPVHVKAYSLSGKSGPRFDRKSHVTRSINSSKVVLPVEKGSSFDIVKACRWIKVWPANERLSWAQSDRSGR